MTDRRILLDMDGVIADFVQGAADLWHMPNQYREGAVVPGTFLTTFWGMDQDKFWRGIAKAGDLFWQNLPRTPEAKAIVNLCCSRVGVENVAILTSPTRDPGCIEGKRAWMVQNFPELAGRMIFTTSKEFLACPQNILVDDQDNNFSRFIAAGGRAVMVPRMWNRLHGCRDRVLECVRTALDAEICQDLNREVA